MRLPWLLRVTENQGLIPEREPEKWLPHPRKAAGTQITHSRHGEVVTKNNKLVLLGSGIVMGTTQIIYRGSIGGQVWCQQPR